MPRSTKDRLEFKFTYSVTTPVKHFIGYSTVDTTVRVASAEVSDRNIHVDPHWSVFSSCPSQSSLIIAAPRVDSAAVCESQSVHASANDLDY